VLVHPFDREYFDNFEDIQYELPSLEEEINLIKNYGKSILGVCINSKQNIDANQIKEQFNVPVVNPMIESISAISESIKANLF